MDVLDFSSNSRMYKKAMLPFNL